MEQLLKSNLHKTASNEWGNAILACTDLSEKLNSFV